MKAKTNLFSGFEFSDPFPKGQEYRLKMQPLQDPQPQEQPQEQQQQQQQPVEQPVQQPPPQPPPPQQPRQGYSEDEDEEEEEDKGPLRLRDGYFFSDHVAELYDEGHY